MAIRTFENMHPDIHPTAWVDETALVIGDVSLGADSSVWPMAVARGDIHRIRIGARTNIQDGCVLHVTHAGEHSAQPEGAPVTIGDGVIVGHRAVLHGCTLEDACMIGNGALVMDNVVVERHALVAAGAVVPPGKVLTGGYLWRGAPARQARPLTDREMAYFEYSANYYVELKNRHIASTRGE
jgi:carbonic anhydrase/acetyltransferase-like protein (isoleucine patch superfamily)